VLRALFLLGLWAPVGLAAADPSEYLHAVSLVKQQNWQEALPIIHELLGQYPHNPKLLNLYGLALTQGSKTEDARSAFESALRTNPNFSPALKNLSIVEWNAGLPGGSAHTEAALKLEPQDPVLNAYGALGAIARQDLLSATERLTIAGPATAALPMQLSYRLAVELGENKLYPQSISVFQQLIEAGRDSPSVRYNLALAEFQTERYRDSIQTLQSHTPSSDAMNLLAQAYGKSGESQKAIDTLRDAIALYPQEEDNYLDLANMCVDIGALDKAIAVVQTGLTYRSTSARLNFQAGLLWMLSGDFEHAQTAFERAASLQPESDLPQAAIEMANIQQAHLAEALTGLRRQVKEKPNSSMLWYLLGTALTHSGAADQSAEQKEAAAAYKMAMQLDPQLPWPYVELAKIYGRWKRPGDAAALLEKAIAMDVASRAAYYQLALAYRQMNQPQRAREMLAKVKQLNASDRGEKTFLQNSPEEH
jgi:tetratricopeptide (TPR) repeat protein